MEIKHLYNIVSHLFVNIYDAINAACILNFHVKLCVNNTSKYIRMFHRINNGSNLDLNHLINYLRQLIVSF